MITSWKIYFHRSPQESLARAERRASRLSRDTDDHPKSTTMHIPSSSKWLNNNHNTFCPSTIQYNVGVGGRSSYSATLIIYSVIRATRWEWAKYRNVLIYEWQIGPASNTKEQQSCRAQSSTTQTNPVIQIHEWCNFYKALSSAWWHWQQEC